MANLDLRRSLLQLGFRWIQPSAQTIPEQFRFVKGMKFIKRYLTSHGEFEVLVINITSDLTKLPLVFVVEKPKEFARVSLPHIRNSGTVCYADNDQSEWNPLDPESFAQAIDKKISITLQEAIDNRNNLDEYRNEFSNYWEGRSTVFSFEELPTSTKRLNYTSFMTKIGQEPKEVKEFIVYSETHERDRWLELRGMASPVEGGSAIVVSVKPNNWAPASTWPPISFAEVLNWLAKADRSAHDQLLSRLIQLAAKRALVILQIIGEGQLGFHLSFTSRHLNLLESLGKRKSRSLKRITPSFASPKAIESFSRLQVEAIDRDSIFLRNRPKPDLGDIRNLRIALIGCGTIGGYVAELLVKSGAGIGAKGKLSLYDSDTLSVGNLGRHRLPISFLNWNKADAIAKLIKDESLHRVNLDVKKEDFETSVSSFRKYDVVIDATGRVPVSLALAGLIRSISNPPILIHGFNDLWGQESVAFLDNGKACYGCLGKLAPTNIKKPDFDTSRYSCGSFYTPYDANVSVITASLIVEAVLNTLEDKLKWTYTKVTREATKPQKSSLLKPWADCKVCGQGSMQ